MLQKAGGTHFPLVPPLVVPTTKSQAVNCLQYAQMIDLRRLVSGTSGMVLTEEDTQLHDKTDRQTDRQADRQIDRQTDGQTGRLRHTNRF